MRRLGLILLAILCSQTLLFARGVDIVPMPDSVEYRKGEFNIAGVKFYADAECQAVYAVEKLADQLSLVSGKRARMVKHKCWASVRFLTDRKLGGEEYRIDIGRRKLTVWSSSKAGTLYAIQSLKQMLPLEIYGHDAVEDLDWSIPCVRIKDMPRLGYRGVLLDCARHFFTVNQIKEYLDILAMYKVNRFHWHLTDDHAWRLEIKKYPLLTEIGAHNCGAEIDKDPNIPGEILYDGFYTQEQAREIVAYADSLGITVIPEIDMPSHMTAALAAYPYLGCTGGPYEVIRVVGPRVKGLAKDALCPGRETTFQFIEEVLDEVIDIFPSKYIHIGGDECIKDRWYECDACKARMESEGIVSDGKYTNGQYLQVYFINRVQKYLNGRGRSIIGWDEILDGNLDYGATVMSWRGVSTGHEAAARRFNVIMAPVSYCYLDYRQSTEIDREPRAFAGPLTIEKVYSFDPYEGMSVSERWFVNGVQGNLWTDVIGLWKNVEYMLLPRLAALSEVQWCYPETKDFDRFRASMDHHARIYDISGYAYGHHLWGKLGYQK